MIFEPKNVDINIYKDRDFIMTMYLTDANGEVYNTLNWEFIAQIRSTKGSSTLIANIDVSHSYVYGSLVLTMTDDVTRELNVDNPITVGSATTASTCYWDLLAITAGNRKYSICEGTAVIHETVSRED